MLPRAAALLAVVAILAALLFYSQWRSDPPKVSGFIETDEIRLASLVGGRVAKVLVEEGTEVAANEVLIELEPYDLQERRQEAEAELAAREAELSRYKAGFRAEEIAEAEARVAQLQALVDELTAGPRAQEIDAARADVDVAVATLELAQQNYNRASELRRNNTITQEDFDRATQELRAAIAVRAAREKQLELLLAGTREEQLRRGKAQLAEAQEILRLRKNGYRPEEIAAAEGAVAAARARIAVLDAQRKELAIRAPSAGAIESLDLQPGDVVSPGAPVLSMINPRELWVRAYVPERFLHLRVGQELKVAVDTYPGETFRGTVTFISRQAEFTPTNVQTPEERSKQVFRIKVALNNDSGKLLPGMSADVWLPAREERGAAP